MGCDLKRVESKPSKAYCSQVIRETAFSKHRKRAINTHFTTRARTGSSNMRAKQHLSHSHSCSAQAPPPSTTSTTTPPPSSPPDATLALAADHTALDCDLWEMALLSCARKHRSLLWYKYHRSVVRRGALAATRKQQLRALNSSNSSSSSAAPMLACRASPLQPLAMGVTPLPPLTTVASASTLTAREVTEQPSAATTGTASASNVIETTQAGAKDSAKNVDITPKEPEPETPSPPPSSGSWRAMLVTLFAMISPEWGKEVSGLM